MPTKRTLRGVSVTLSLTLAVSAGCSAADPEIATPVTPDGGDDATDGLTSSTPPDPTTDAGDTDSEASGSTASADAGATTAATGADGVATLAGAADHTRLVAVAKADTLAIWSSPSESTAPERSLTAADEASGEIVLLVKQQLGPTWIEVYLPTAPSGSTGWVRRDEVDLTQHAFRIEVSRARHMLTVYDGNEAILETPVSIGAVDAPQPTDGLFVKDLVETPEPDGPYGRYAYGLSGSSNRAEQFTAGAGIVAIHGTADPAALGTDVPTGSLGIAADALERMVTDVGVPLGTPLLLVD
jgi:lipoprotein-anchoring transpeptidase ErfK/SrfK